MRGRVFLPAKRHNRARLARNPSSRFPVAFAVAIGIALSATASAHAATAPTLVATYPVSDGAVRSQDAGEIFALYEEDLSELQSTFVLRDAVDAVVAGTTLFGDSSGTGHRSIRFRADAPLTESAGPYRATVRAYLTVPAEQTHTVWFFDVDDTAPPGVVVASPNDGDIVTGDPVTVIGTAEPGNRIVVVEDADPLAEGLATEAGDFAVELPYPPEDGVSHTFEVIPKDEAGNAGPSTGPITIWHDSHLDAPVIFEPHEGETVGASSVAIRGTAKPNATVRVREGATLLAVTAADGDGVWTTTVSFPDGPHTITATSFDGTITDGPSLPRSFSVDTIPPGAPVVLTPAEGEAISSHSILVSGTAEPGVTVEITRDGDVLGTTTADESGAWSTTLILPDDDYTIVVTARDAGGNEASTVRSFVVDTIPPDLPVFTDPEHESFLNDPSVFLAGTAEPGSIIELTEAMGPVGNAVTSGAGVWSVTIPFADGHHTVEAVAVDQAGNRSPRSLGRSFTVDTVAPAPPVITEPAPASTILANQVTVKGTAEPNTAIALEEAGDELTRTASGEDGFWSTKVMLANGVHTLEAITIDLAGNVSAGNPTVTFTVDGTGDVAAPDPPVIDYPAENDAVPASFAVSGTAEPGATVTIYENDAAIADGTANDGFFELQVAMGDGVHQITATATDPSGNESAPSSVRTFTVDGFRPEVQIETADGALVLPLQDTAITGTATDNVGVVQVEIEYRALDGTVARAGIAACDCPGTLVSWDDTATIGPGIYKVRVWAIDAVGARSAPAEISLYVL
ncbi:MAG TPA: Ig-like domain-containing protein [Actinomycetota bacterium]